MCSIEKTLNSLLPWKIVFGKSSKITKKKDVSQHTGGLKMDDGTSWWGHKEGLQGMAGIWFRRWWRGSILTVGYHGGSILTERTG